LVIFMEDLHDRARGGDDDLYGGSGADFLYGDAAGTITNEDGSDDISGSGRGGDDSLYGGEGDDVLAGDGGSASGGTDALSSPPARAVWTRSRTSSRARTRSTSGLTTSPGSPT
jgi:RTX calcium-binding nonapeptide repeat (4 copies)